MDSLKHLEADDNTLLSQAAYDTMHRLILTPIGKDLDFCRIDGGGLFFTLTADDDSKVTGEVDKDGKCTIFFK